MPNYSSTSCIQHGTALVPERSRKVTEKSEGLLEGTVSWEGDLTGVSPAIGSVHPDDSRMKAFQVSTTREGDNKKVDVSYMGLVSTTTPPVFNYDGASNQASIETHPLFREFAGDPLDTDEQSFFHCPMVSESIKTYVKKTDGSGEYELKDTGHTIEYRKGRNGAVFDKDSGVLIGFTDPKSPLAGQTVWWSPGIQIEVVFYTTAAANLNNMGTVYASFPHAGVDEPSGIVNWFLPEVTATPVAGTDIKKVREVYIGYDNADGFVPELYSAALQRSGGVGVEGATGVVGP